MQPLPSVSVTCGTVVSQNGKQKADHSGSSFKPSSSSCTFLKHHLTGEEMASHCQSSGSFHCSRMVQSSFSHQFANSRTQHLASSPWCSAGGKSSDGICKCSNDLFVHLCCSSAMSQAYLAMLPPNLQAVSSGTVFGSKGKLHM